MHEPSKSTSLSRSIGALGVVYGDIGTSVLYAFKECLVHGLGQRGSGGAAGVSSRISLSFFPDFG
jgi:K+ transporter